MIICARCKEDYATHWVRSYDDDGKILIDEPACLECAAEAFGWRTLEVMPLDKELGKLYKGNHENTNH